MKKLPIMFLISSFAVQAQEFGPAMNSRPGVLQQRSADRKKMEEYQKSLKDIDSLKPRLDDFKNRTDKSEKLLKKLMDNYEKASVDFDRVVQHGPRGEGIMRNESDATALANTVVAIAEHSVDEGMEQGLDTKNIEKLNEKMENISKTVDSQFEALNKSFVDEVAAKVAAAKQQIKMLPQWATHLGGGSTGAKMLTDIFKNTRLAMQSIEAAIAITQKALQDTRQKIIDLERSIRNAMETLNNNRGE